MNHADHITYGFLLRRAWPLILANCSVPLLGLADTAVLGNLGTLHDLGAIALGALIFSFVYWGFGFLRMGTTGFIAQADGRNDPAEIRAVFLTSLLLALALGAALITLQVLLADSALGLLGGGEQVEATARTYFLIRIWGAPATLGTFVLVGLLVGLGESRKLLAVQLLLNLLNIALDGYFAGYLRLGAAGIALGTLIAEWLAFLCALMLVLSLLRQRHQDPDPFWVIHRLRDRRRLRTLLSVNSDIMIRTVLLVFSFAWFTNQSARFGDVVLAANHVLLQLISFSAFFLDGFAFVVESLVGKAVGARDRQLFDLAVRRTTVLAAFTALLLATLAGFAGPLLVGWLTDLPEVVTTAVRLLPLAVGYILLSFAAFQLDGVFIGATCTAQMRNASAASLLVFLGFWLLLTGQSGVVGLWWSFILYVCARALALLAYYPRLRRSLG